MNSNLYKALKILSDGTYHSGAALGEVLGVSRSAVWKHLQSLGDYGIQIESIKGKGYRLERKLDLLKQETLAELLSTTAISNLSEIVLLDVTESTNSVIRDSGDFHGRFCVAEYQSGGKGRRGRGWFNAFSQGLCFSLGWRFYGSAQVVEGLSLAVGLSIVQSLEDVGFTGLQLKWPNDILFNGIKLAGILVEMQGDLEGPIDIIVGIGINVYSQQEQRIDQPFISLEEIEQVSSRAEILAAILNRLVPLMVNYEQQGFTHYKDDWNRYDAFADQQIKLLMGEKTITGLCKGVNETGALLLQEGSGLQAFSGGEISVRINNDS